MTPESESFSRCFICSPPTTFLQRENVQALAEIARIWRQRLSPRLSRVHYPLTALMYSSSSDSFVGDKSSPFLVFHSFKHNQLTHTFQEQGHADAPGSVPNRLIDESMVACFLLPKPPCQGLALRRRRVYQD